MNEVFDTLRSPERRLILNYLEADQNAVGSELIKHLEEQEDVSENLSFNLHHTHLPKLRDRGWIDYDDRHGSVEDYDLRYEINPDDTKDSILSDYMKQSLGQENEDLNELFDVLKKPERRRTIYWLRKEDNKSNLSQIATYLASDKSAAGTSFEPAEDEILKAKIGLLHQEIPALEDAGIVDYDDKTEKISLTDEYSSKDNLLIEFLEEAYEQS